MNESEEPKPSTEEADRSEPAEASALSGDPQIRIESHADGADGQGLNADGNPQSQAGDADAPWDIEPGESLRPEDLAWMRRPKRPPYLSVISSLMGIALMFFLFDDFSYWLQDDQNPRDLGNALSLVHDGPDGKEFQEDLDNQYVRLEGTPDIQHAKRVVVGKGSREGLLEYLRLLEFDGSLFVAQPRRNRGNDFQGVFEGRMRRLDKSPTGEWLQELFEADEIFSSHQIDRKHWLSTLAKGEAEFRADGGEKLFELQSSDRLTLVLRSSVSRLQLGKKSWKSRSQAEEAVKSLGLPFVWIEGPAESQNSKRFWDFALHLGDRKKGEVLARLHTDKGLTADELKKAGADPGVGALLLSRSYSYNLRPNEIQTDSPDHLRFQPSAKSVQFGWELKDGQLITRSLQDGQFVISSDEIDALHLDRRLKVDPHGYVIAGGVTPSTQSMNAMLFLLVAAVVLVNLIALAFTWRRGGFAFQRGSV